MQYVLPQQENAIKQLNHYTGENVKTVTKAGKSIFAQCSY